MNKLGFNAELASLRGQYTLYRCEMQGLSSSFTLLRRGPEKED
jgi:hypothetical protein